MHIEGRRRLTPAVILESHVWEHTNTSLREDAHSKAMEALHALWLLRACLMRFILTTCSVHRVERKTRIEIVEVQPRAGKIGSKSSGIESA